MYDFLQISYLLYASVSSSINMRRICLSLIESLEGSKEVIFFVIIAIIIVKRAMQTMNSIQMQFMHIILCIIADNQSRILSSVCQKCSCNEENRIR